MLPENLGGERMEWLSCETLRPVVEGDDGRCAHDPWEG